MAQSIMYKIQSGNSYLWRYITSILPWTSVQSQELLMNKSYQQSVITKITSGNNFSPINITSNLSGITITSGSSFLINIPLIPEISHEPILQVASLSWIDITSNLLWWQQFLMTGLLSDLSICKWKLVLWSNEILLKPN